MDQTDIWRAAHQMIKIYGLDAAWQAAMRSDHFLEQGDVQGCKVWKQIVSAIDDLQRSQPSNGQQFH